MRESEIERVRRLGENRSKGLEKMEQRGGQRMREGNTEYYIEVTVQISFLKLTNTSKRLSMLKKHTGFFFPMAWDCKDTLLYDFA